MQAVEIRLMGGDSRGKHRLGKLGHDLPTWALRTGDCKTHSYEAQAEIERGMGGANVRG